MMNLIGQPERYSGVGFTIFPISTGTVTKKSALSRSGALAAGSYVIVLDNTDFGDVTPPMNFSDDVIAAHIKVVLE